MASVYQVVIHGLRGESITLDLCNTAEQMRHMTVQQLKARIAQRLPANLAAHSMRLIFADKMLDGDNTLLSDHGIQHMSHIHMVLKMSGGGLADRSC